MDLRQMRYVLAVAEHGSVRRAAAALYMAQQSLSEQIAAVERDVGAPLFERSRSGMTPTAAGEVFIAHATTVVDAAERALAATRTAAGNGSPTPVRVGVATGLSALAGDLLRRYLLTRPDADVRLMNMRTASQIPALRDGEISAGIAYTPSRPRELKGLMAHRLRVTPIHAMLRRDDPLAVRDRVSLRQLAERPLLLPPREDAAGLRGDLLAMFDAHGLTPRQGPDVHGYEMAFASVAANRGYTLCVPALTKVDDDLTFLPLEESVPSLRTALLTRQGSPEPAIADLITAVREMARTPPRPSANDEHEHT
jgi:DNA-binding transcriptional LysR family regulator